MSRRLLTLLTTAAAAAIVAVIVLALAGIGGGSDRQPSGRSVGRAAAATGADDFGSEDIHALYERAAPAVVFIQARVTRSVRTPFGPSRRRGVSTGTGFLYDDEGHIVTNAHVVAGAGEVALRMGQNRLVDAKLVGSDPSTDLAVLHVDPGALETKPLEIAPTSSVQVGEPVVAIGNPFGLNDTVTAGIVSAVQRRIVAPDGFPIAHVIQTDAAINPGNSGGPLLDARGRVIGVNAQIATGGGTKANAGIGFAIPGDTVRDIVPQLIAHGRVAHPFLGVSTVPVTPRLADQLHLGVDHGALVVAVAPGSPAARAGLRAAAGNERALVPGGDVIVEVGGRKVAGPEELAAAVAAHDPGDEVTVVFVRDGRRHSASIALATR